MHIIHRFSLEKNYPNENALKGKHHISSSLSSTYTLFATNNFMYRYILFYFKPFVLERHGLNNRKNMLENNRNKNWCCLHVMYF